MITKKTIQGITVETSLKNFNNAQYVIFDNKIWNKTGSQGAGIKYAMKLERPNNIVLWVKGKQLKEVKYIVSPTGYIDLSRFEAPKKTITQGQYIEFINEVFTQELRTGQYFCNKFNISDADIYYCTDKKEVLKKIAEYINL